MSGKSAKIRGGKGSSSSVTSSRMNLRVSPKRSSENELGKRELELGKREFGKFFTCMFNKPLVERLALEFGSLDRPMDAGPMHAGPMDRPRDAVCRGMDRPNDFSMNIKSLDDFCIESDSSLGIAKNFCRVLRFIGVFTESDYNDALFLSENYYPKKASARLLNAFNAEISSRSLGPSSLVVAPSSLVGPGLGTRIVGPSLGTRIVANLMSGCGSRSSILPHSSTRATSIVQDHYDETNHAPSGSLVGGSLPCGSGSLPGSPRSVGNLVCSAKFTGTTPWLMTQTIKTLVDITSPITPDDRSYLKDWMLPEKRVLGRHHKPLPLGRHHHKRPEKAPVRQRPEKAPVRQRPEKAPPPPDSEEEPPDSEEERYFEEQRYFEASKENNF